MILCVEDDENKAQILYEEVRALRPDLGWKWRTNVHEGISALSNEVTAVITD